MDIHLRINSHEVFDFEPSEIRIDFNLKDIKEPSKKKTSFSKPLTIWQSKNTSQIFHSLFNINSKGGYDMRKKVPAQLIENGQSIINGYLYLEEVTKDFYSVIIANNDVDLFKSVGDKELRALNFDNLYNHTISRQHIASQFNSSLNHTGKGLYYTVIDKDNHFTTIDDLAKNFEATPSVCVYELFEKIVADNNYTYSMSDTVKDELKKIVLPYNGELDIDNGIEYHYLYSHFLTLDLANQNFIWLSDDFDINENYIDENTPSELIPEDDIARALWFPKAGNFNHFEDDFGFVVNEKWSGGMVFDTKGKYKISGVVEYNNATDDEKNVEVRLINKFGDTIISLGKSDLVITPNNGTHPTTGDPIPTFASFTLIKEFEIKAEHVGQTFYLSFKRSDIKVKIINTTAFNMYKLNYLYADNVQINLNDVIAKDYKQKDFLDDIVKLFNFHVQADHYNSKLLHFRTYDEFYSNPDRLDWTNKIDADSIRFRDLTNELPKEYSFSFSDGSDQYNKHYKEIKGKTFNSLKVNNTDSEIASGNEAITLTIAPAATVSLSEFIIIPKIVGDTKPRFLYLNRLQAPANSVLFADQLPINFILTAISYMDYSGWIVNVGPIDETNANYLGFDNSDGYMVRDTITRSNHTIYNRFYKREIESYLHGDFKFLVADFRLNASDINIENFRNLIYISDNEIGDSYYRLNSIKSYSPDAFCEVELIKINPYSVSYPSDIQQNIITIPVEE